MNKIRKIILAVLTLALVFALAACTFGGGGSGTATKRPDTPTEEPADPLAGIWAMLETDSETGEESESGVYYVFEKDGAAAIKGGGNMYPFTWSRADDKIIVTTDDGDEVVRIIELTDEKLELKLPDEDETIKFVRKQPRTAQKVDRDELIDRWDYVDNYYEGAYLQFYADGYGESFGDKIELFSWTLEGDELRVYFIESDNSYYSYISISGDKLTMDNEVYEPNELVRNTKEARTVNKINKDDLLGSWDMSGNPLAFNKDGTGSVGGSDFRWNLFGDVLQLCFEKDGEDYFEHYYTAAEGNTLTLTDGNSSYEFTRK
ncbi:MAG: lipocalin family protein [Clostridia bacterium]|nr:lipocalin family protein [Clostridia bacterium]